MNSKPRHVLESASRRALLERALLAAGLLLPLAALAADADNGAAAAVAKVLNKRAPLTSGLKFTTPAIAENGNTVPVSVEVEGAFSAEHYVKAIHLFAEGNPAPEVISFRFTPRSGRAKVATRIRLAKTQRVVALAEWSDGRVLEAINEVKVTIGGCGG
ncbi:MAG: thiosulfate oxidation carrier protein SoxY [Gammaproteobacteria bacterium]|nr:thiosulfate oxidation carrier protein SoxY [Gammaproteobacteria bacterium]